MVLVSSHGRARVTYRRFTSWCLLLLVASTAVLISCDALPWLQPPSGEALGFNVDGESTDIDVDGDQVFRMYTLFDEIPGKIGSHAPAIIAFDDGALLAAWYAYSGPNELMGSAIYTARRPAGATTWQAPQLHIARLVGDGNPVLYHEDDRVWLFQAVVPLGWATAHIEVQRSSDRGNTWSDPAAVEGPLGSNVRFPPIHLDDGTLLLPAYDDLRLRSLFFVSDDGVEWTLRSELFSPLPHATIQPSLVTTRGGRLLAVMRNGGGGWLWVSASTDHGHTWAEPADGGFVNPGTPAQLLRLAGGNLALIFNDSATQRRRLSIALSADDGRSWPHCRVLVDGELKYSYPAAVQAPDGLIHILYSHDRRTIGHITCNEAWIAAADADRTERECARTPAARPPSDGERRPPG